MEIGSRKNIEWHEEIKRGEKGSEVFTEICSEPRDRLAVTGRAPMVESREAEDSKLKKNKWIMIFFLQIVFFKF